MLAYWLHKIKFTLYLVIGSWVLFYLLNIFFPFSPQLQWSSLLHDSKGEILFASLNEDDKWRMYTTLDEISPELRKAIVFKEDRHFYKHPGVNPLAIIRALAGNAIKGQRNSGASTIPMQIARLLEPRPRTYRSKLIEMFRALQLDMQYSKRELLQMYLNLAPYGGNIEGVKAASLCIWERALPNSTWQTSPPWPLYQTDQTVCDPGSIMT